MRTDPDTQIGSGRGRFPSTIRSLVQDRTGRSEEERRKDLQRLIDLYWKPVYCLIRHARARSNEDAKDLTQEFFVREILEGNVLKNFAPDQGSFRAYLKAVVTNFLRHAARDAQALKRGGEVRVIPLEHHELDISDLVPDAHALPPEQVFDAAWKQVLLDRAMVLLERKLRDEGKAVYFEVFQRYDLDSGNETLSYRDIGEELGLSADTVKNYLTRARQEYKKAVTEIICDYVDTPEDLSQELAELFGT